MRAGVTSFETSFAGLGGCPFTKVAAGNVATEDFVHVMQLEGLRKEAQDAGGSLVLHDAPPPLKRQVEAWGAPGDGIDMMRRLKAEFDPRGLCNPGRFVGGI